MFSVVGNGDIAASSGSRAGDARLGLYRRKWLMMCRGRAALGGKT